MSGDNRLVTENFLRLNFTPNSGITPGTDDLISMSCDQILARYAVSISGVTATGLRLPGQNQLTAGTIVQIGDSYQGGIVAYIFVSGDAGYVSGETHGLIAAAMDQGYVAWSNVAETSVAGTSSAIGYGQANTNLIIAQSGHTNSAAKLCDDLSLNGYSDWYLPSYEELKRLRINQVLIGGFASADYFSSTEYDFYRATIEDFGNASPSARFKSSSHLVRAIRSF